MAGWIIYQKYLYDIVGDDQLPPRVILLHKCVCTQHIELELACNKQSVKTKMRREKVSPVQL